MSTSISIPLDIPDANENSKSSLWYCTNGSRNSDILEVPVDTEHNSDPCSDEAFEYWHNLIVEIESTTYLPRTSTIATMLVLHMTHRQNNLAIKKLHLHGHSCKGNSDLQLLCLHCYLHICSKLLSIGSSCKKQLLNPTCNKKLGAIFWWGTWKKPRNLASWKEIDRSIAYCWTVVLIEHCQWV